MLVRIVDRAGATAGAPEHAMPKRKRDRTSRADRAAAPLPAAPDAEVELSDPARRHWGSECLAPRTSASTRSLAAELLTGGPTRVRFPRNPGSFGGFASRMGARVIDEQQPGPSPRQRSRTTHDDDRRDEQADPARR
jgi:hypothetical protein